MKRSLTKYTFKVPGYDTIRKDRSTGVKGGVAFLVKHGLVVNKEYRNEDFNIITENEALAINLELSNNQNLTLATIYCPNGNPSSSLFHAIFNLSDNVMFIGDFNSKLESFGCAKKKHLRSYAQNYPINNKKRSYTQLDSRKQVIAFQDRVITINIKEAQHPLK